MQYLALAILPWLVLWMARRSKGSPRITGRTMKTPRSVVQEPASTEAQTPPSPLSLTPDVTTNGHAGQGSECVHYPSFQAIYISQKWVEHKCLNCGVLMSYARILAPVADSTPSIYPSLDSMRSAQGPVAAASPSSESSHDR